jgi:hypothetical protein
MGIISAKAKQLMRTYELDLEDVMFAQLVANGYGEQEAAQVIYQPLKMSLATFARKKMEQKSGIKLLIDNIKADEERAQRRIDELLATVDSKGKGKGKSKASFDKDRIIEELHVQYERAKDGKEKAEIMMKIADIMQVKKEEAKEEDKRLTYYLPLRCEICPWKNKK